MKQFGLGQVVATPGAIEAMEKSGEMPFTFLIRHMAGDWGDVPKEDWQANNLATEHGERLLSAYKTKDGTKLWVITEWDRSVTTLLLPDEY